MVRYYVSYSGGWFAIGGDDFDPQVIFQGTTKPNVGSSMIRNFGEIPEEEKEAVKLYIKQKMGAAVLGG